MLTDIQIRKAAARGTPYKLGDAGGLYLYITAAGGKSWRLKYRFLGKEKTLTFGMWPAVTLAQARQLAAQAKEQLAAGRDPSLEQRKAKAAAVADAAATLDSVAREWHKKQAGRWEARYHAAFMASLERDIFPALGQFPIAEITPPLLLAELIRVERRGAIETAHRLRRRVEQVYAYAVATGRAETNPALQLRGALTPASREGKEPAVLTVPEVQKLFAVLQQHQGQPETRACAMFQALTAVRPSDAREARWSEFEGLDGPAPVWTVPASRLKGTRGQKADARRRHIVPLSAAAVAVLLELKPYTGHHDLVFASFRFPTRPLSDNTLSMLYRRAGYEGRHVPHGWRASFSSIMNERREDMRQAIDAALAHVIGGVEGRYNRSEHLVRRRELFEEWAGILKGET